MIFVANAIVDNSTVMIKTFHTFLADHAVDGSGRPDRSAMEAKVIYILFLN